MKVLIKPKEKTVPTHTPWKAALVLLLAFGLFGVTTHAQQWSSDPLVDKMKADEAAILKFQELTFYCKSHYWEKQCDGSSGNPPSTFMPYEDALKLGNQARAADASVVVAKPKTLGEIAREEREKKQIEKEQNIDSEQATRELEVLQQIGLGVRNLCAKQPDVKGCKTGETTDQIAQQVFKTAPDLQAYVKDGKLPPQKEKPNTAEK
jgi:hypothetical protein